MGEAEAGPVPRILLVGMMGAGKTTVGRGLAQRFGWPYLDSDEEVRRRSGKTVPQIFAEDGEAAFRVQEAAVLAEACNSDHPVIVSVAGGAVLDPENRKLITSSGLVVWLRASLTTLTHRVGDGRTRPLLGDDPAAALRRLYPERAALYGQVASVVIDVDDQPTDRVVELVARAVGERSQAGGRT